MSTQLNIKSIDRKIFLYLILSALAHYSFAQSSDSTRVVNHFGCAVTITSKGISTIPNLTLGKPAVIFDLSIGKRKLSFEPQFRFALDGKPWTIIFWWRYKMIKTDKFQFSIGAHPAIAFKTITVSKDGVTQEIIRAQRYLAGELYPGYFVTKNINVGIYYLYSYGLEDDAIKNTNLLGLRCNFSNIKLSDQFFMRFNSQIYFLKMDENNGYYFNSTLTLARRDFPLSVSSLINKAIRTEIPVGEDFVWNVSLIYSFNKDYVIK